MHRVSILGYIYVPPNFWPNFYFSYNLDKSREILFDSLLTCLIEIFLVVLWVSSPSGGGERERDRKGGRIITYF